MRSPPERWGPASRRGWRSDAGGVPGQPGREGGRKVRPPSCRPGRHGPGSPGRRREADGGEGGDRERVPGRKGA